MFRAAALLLPFMVAASGKVRVHRLPPGLAHRPEFAFPLEEDDGRIVGGEEVEPYSIPYQVSFQGDGPLGRGHFCGGSVYDETHVITAAHCCKGAFNTLIVAGEHNLTEAEGREQVRSVTDMLVHPNYTPYTNDICILTLENPLDLK